MPRHRRAPRLSLPLLISVSVPPRGPSSRWIRRLPVRVRVTERQFAAISPEFAADGRRPAAPRTTGGRTGRLTVSAPVSARDAEGPKGSGRRQGPPQGRGGAGPTHRSDGGAEVAGRPDGTPERARPAAGRSDDTYTDTPRAARVGVRRGAQMTLPFTRRAGGGYATVFRRWRFNTSTMRRVSSPVSGVRRRTLA